MKTKLIMTAVTGVFIVAIGLVLVLKHIHTQNMNNIVQPINFSHKTHIHTVGLECTHCHQYADKSKHATVPAMSICMECHKNVKTDSPEIQKLTKYWNDKDPVPWVKIHNVPEHVYFSHKRHIKAGIDCVACHSDVGSMDVMRQTRTLEMGMCVGCHKQRDVSIDCLTCHK